MLKIKVITVDVTYLNKLCSPDCGPVVGAPSCGPDTGSGNCGPDYGDCLPD